MSDSIHEQNTDQAAPTGPTESPLSRRKFLGQMGLAASLGLAGVGISRSASGDVAEQDRETPPAEERLNELGTENSWQAERVGLWDVVQTSRVSPEAEPTTADLVAERTMVGSFLQEIVRPASGSNTSDIARIDYLSFNRVEGRWKYVSMDTRAPVGIMPAASYGRGEEGRIDLTFEPFAVAGTEADASGRMLRMEQSIIRENADRDRKDQYFVVADGTGQRWLGNRYAYTRR